MVSKVNKVNLNWIKNNVDFTNRIAYKNNRMWLNRVNFIDNLLSRYKNVEYNIIIPVDNSKLNEHYIVFFSKKLTYIRIIFDNVLKEIYIDSESKKDIINIYDIIGELGYN